MQSENQSPTENISKSLWKVHFTYNARENERIVDPILSEKPNSLYYFHFDDGNRSDINLKYQSENLEAIEKALPKCEIHKIGINYVDYYQIISKLAKIISDEQLAHGNHEVRFQINLGTGSKMVAIANMDAHRLWPNIDIIYPYSEEYDPTAETTHSGSMKGAEPPKFEFKHPGLKILKSIQILYVLRDTEDNFGHKHDYVKQSDLAYYVYDVFQILKVKSNEDPRKLQSSQLMQLKRRIIDRLDKNWGFITREKVGRDYHIFFTEKGEKMAKVFINYNYGIDLTRIHLPISKDY